MKICLLELTGLLEMLPVLHHHGAALRLDQALTSKLLERAVHMNGAEAQRVAQFSLRERQLVGMASRPSHGFEAHEKLAQEVSDAPIRVPAAQADHSLAE